MSLRPPADPGAGLLLQGFALFRGVLPGPLLAQLGGAFDATELAGAGSRCLLQQPWCAALLPALRSDARLAPLLADDLVAVQCTGFEKSAARNWLVSIHQDLSAPVAEPADHPELGGWARKEGGLFVQPPAALLARMLALRVHLDPCGAEDGALRVLPGSHRQGRVDAQDARLQRLAAEERVCECAPGDVLAMRPLLLHASSRARGGSRRRVLHFLFAPREPGYGLRWARAL